MIIEIVLLLFILIMISFLIFCISIKNEDFKKYNGLVLFDIDGTLTPNNASYNSLIVQACIDKNFAVGICTANSGYSMENILTFDWMPSNLYNFICKEKNITFNNVGSKLLMGKTSKTYSNLLYQQPGYLKGFALEKTANILGITNPNCMILCDDDQGYIEYAFKYKPTINIVNCGVERLSIQNLNNAMSKCYKL